MPSWLDAVLERQGQRGLRGDRRRLLKCCPKCKGRCVKGTCCPLKRTTFAPGTNRKGVACCPPGTIAVPGAVGLCCPKGDLDCCTPKDADPDDDLVPLSPKLKRGQLCVKGEVRKV